MGRKSVRADALDPTTVEDPNHSISKIDQWTKLGQLGQGSFGTAYLVKRVDETDMNTYVMKEIRCRDKEQLIDALREMVVLRILQCKWVVRFEDYWTEGLSVFLIMEFCPGGDLYRELNAAIAEDRTIPEPIIMRWFTQMLLGLDQIHQRSFMHRDIKPSNVFLDIHGNAKLGDFGLSQVVIRPPDQSIRGTICGSPGFLSPELERGDKYNAKCDVWAIACTLYECVLLRSAYQDSLEGNFPLPVPDHYSPELKSLLSSMLIEDFRSRPSVSDILKNKFLAGYVLAETGGQQAPVVFDSAPSSTITNQPTGPLDLVMFAQKCSQGSIMDAWEDVCNYPREFFFLFALVVMSLKVIGII